MAAPERVFNRNVPDAGNFDQRITLEIPAPTIDELGQSDISWIGLGEFWAQVIETPGREFLKGEYRAEERTVFAIRWMDIDSTARVTWDGRTWDILSVTGTRRDGYRWLHTIAMDGAN